MKKPSISYTLLTNILTTGFGLIGSIILARTLGAEGRGELAIILLWPTLLVYLASIGLFPATTFFASSPDKEIVKKVFSNLIIFAALQSALVLLVGNLFLPLVLNKQSETIISLSKFFLWSVPLGMGTQYFLSILKAFLLFPTFNIVRLIIPIGYFLCVLLFWITNNLSITNLTYAQLYLNLITLVASFLALLIHKIPLALNPDMPLGKKMLKYGFKVWLGDLSQSMNLKLDQVLIASLLDARSLGYYVVALTAVSFSNVISEAFKVILTPLVSNQTDPNQKIKHIITYYESYWGINIVMHAGLMLAVPIIIPIMFGNEFIVSIIPAEFLIIASLFINAKNVLAGGFQGLGHPWIPTIAEISGMIVTVVLLLILLKPLGILGAALATLAAYFSQYVYMIVNFKKICSVSYRDIFKPNMSYIQLLIKKIYRA